MNQANTKWWKIFAGIFAFGFIISIWRLNQLQSQVATIKKSVQSAQPQVANQAKPKISLQPTPTGATKVTVPTADDGNQTSTETKLKVLIPGGVFVNQCLSGEEGVFAQNGKLNIAWGADYTPDMDASKNKGVASWSIKNDRLVLSGTKISDGSYGNLKYFDQKGSLIIDTRATKNECGVVIGVNKNSVETYLINN